LKWNTENRVTALRRYTPGGGSNLHNILCKEAPQLFFLHRLQFSISMIFARNEGLYHRGEKVGGICRESYIRKAFGNRKKCRSRSAPFSWSAFSHRFTSGTEKVCSRERPGKPRGADWKPSRRLERSPVGGTVVRFDSLNFQDGEVGSSPLFSPRNVGPLLSTDGSAVVTATWRVTARSRRSAPSFRVGGFVPLDPRAVATWLRSQ
jgi:hypothetical protein